ncbi:MAG: hypothetical protein E6622_12035, partial [Staphylococcus epidermidis]|nr:hypothetical protein [Staphylococcus epidermidis]
KLVTKMKTKNENIVSICRSITIFLLILAILITILYDSKIGILFALSGFISSAIPDIYNKKKIGWFFLILSLILIILFFI